MIILEEQSSLIFRPDRLRDTELLEINRIGHQRPDFPLLRWILLDLSAVEKIELTAEGVRQAARLDAAGYARNPGLRIALIASSAVMTGMTNLCRANFEIHGKDQRWQIEVFTDEHQARAWLVDEASGSANTSDS